MAMARNMFQLNQGVIMYQDKKQLKQQWQAIYLDWLNNYLSIELYAEHHDLTIGQANALIDLGRECHIELTEG